MYNAEELPEKPHVITDADVVDKGGLEFLNIQHRKIIALHLSGLSHTKIAKELNIKVTDIISTLNDKLAKNLIIDFTHIQNEEFKRAWTY